METYEIGLVPGPVSVPPELRAPYQRDYGSPDLEEEFFTLYQVCEGSLGRMLATGNRVLAAANGVFGYGIADMARGLGMTVEVVDFGYDDVPDPDQVREAARRLRPRLLTAVHCETPSGTLAELAPLGAISAEVGALFYVDFVSSGGGVEIRVDDWHIDLGLLGSQKVLSLPPDLAMVTVSERAWEAVKGVGYVGYDALAPWRTGVGDRHLPYTHNWRAMTALYLGTKRLLEESLPAVFKRHGEVAALCRERLRAMGVELFPKSEAICAPTVTAAKIPPGWTWPDLDRGLRARGMVVGGSYGPLAGKVFRIGHMGSQADGGLVGRGMDVLATVLEGKR